MNGVVSLVTNNKRSPLTIALGKAKLCTFKPGETKRFDFDVWSASSKIAKSMLQKLNTAGTISVKTQLYSGDKVIETENGRVTIMDAVKETPKKLPVVAPKKEVKKSNQVSMIKAAVLTDSKRGYKIVENEKMAMLGAKPVSNDVHSTIAMHNNIQKYGFEPVKHTAHDSNVFSGAIAKEASKAKPVKETAVNPVTIIEQEVLEDKPVKMPEEDIDTYIGSLLAAGDWNTLVEFLRMHYPDKKFTKTKLKQFTSVPDLKAYYAI